jgi:hypothetical protein
MRQLGVLPVLYPHGPHAHRASLIMAEIKAAQLSTHGYVEASL